jgi:Domain of unknown function (DUF4145)
MTKALAWPATVILVCLIFRRHVGGLLKGMQLRRITRGSWSADFEVAAREVRAELPSLAQGLPMMTISGQLDGDIEQLVDIAPGAAISQAWNRLEQRVADIAAQADVTQKLLPESLRALVERGIVQPSVSDSVLGLRNMRNLAVHAPTKQVTPEQAREFVTMVEAIMWSLDQNLKKAGVR